MMTCRPGCVSALGQKNYPGALPPNSGKRIENLLILYYNVTNCSFLRDKLDG